MLIAQLSDTHVTPEGRLASGRVDTAAHLERAVEHVARFRPALDAVLLTGDLVDAGSADEYARLRRLLAPLQMPVYVIPGNHDDRDALRAAFPDHAYLPASGFLQYAIDEFPLRLIGLDTLVPGHPHGELCDERLAWLEARLSESRKPTLLFLHHPPFACSLEAMDAMRLLTGADKLAALVSRHPNIERIICGHVHRPIHTRWAGTTVSVCPSTAHQVTLALEPGVRTTFTMDPPAIALHRWESETGLVTHLSYIGDYDAPPEFRGHLT